MSWPPTQPPKTLPLGLASDILSMPLLRLEEDPAIGVNTYVPLNVSMSKWPCTYINLVWAPKSTNIGWNPQWRLNNPTFSLKKGLTKL